MVNYLLNYIYDVNLKAWAEVPPYEHHFTVAPIDLLYHFLPILFFSTFRF